MLFCKNQDEYSTRIAKNQEESFLIYRHEGAGDAFGQLLAGEGLDIAGLESGDALRGADLKRYSVFRFNHAMSLGFAVLAFADDSGVGLEVLLKRVEPVAALLIDSVQTDIAVHLAYAVLLNLLLAHVKQVEHLHLMGFDLVPEGDIELNMRLLDETRYTQVVGAEDIVALHAIYKYTHDILFLAIGEHCLSLALVADLPVANVLHRIGKVEDDIAHAPERLVHNDA